MCVEFPQVQCDLSELIHVLKAVGHDEKWKLKLLVSHFFITQSSLSLLADEMSF